MTYTAWVESQTTELSERIAKLVGEFGFNAPWELLKWTEQENALRVADKILALMKGE